MDEIQEDKNKDKKFVSNTLNDTFLSGFGSVAPRLVMQGANSIFSSITNDKDTFLYVYEPKEGQQDWSAWGVYGVTAGALNDLYNRVGSLDGTTDLVTKGGIESKYEKREVELTPEETSLIRTSFIVDALGLIGVSDADLLRMNQKIKLQMDRNMQKKYGGETSIQIYKSGEKAEEYDPKLKERREKAEAKKEGKTAQPQRSSGVRNSSGGRTTSTTRK